MQKKQQGGTMKKLKRSMSRQIILIITAFIMIVNLTACESSSNTESSNRYKVDVETQTEDFYVNDFANLFSEEEKQIMMTNAVKLAEDYDGIQVVVTTVNNLKGNEIEEYAYSMYEQYGIGKDSMGILILLSVEDGVIRIETGKTMQVYITDSISGRLLDEYGMDYFRKEQFVEGLIAVQEAVISEIKNVVPIDWNGGEEKETNLVTAVVSNPKEDVDNSKEQSTEILQNKNKMEEIDMVFAVLFFIALVIIGILIIAYRKIKAALSEITKKNKMLSAHVETLQIDMGNTTNKNAQLSREVENLNKELKETNSEHKKVIQNMEIEHKKTYNELNAQISNITQENIVLNEEVAKTQEFYGRVRKLHPECDFEKEVENMIEAEFRAAVSSVDNQINAVIDMPADKDSIEIFGDVINMYETTENDIREAVTADISKVRDLYNESVNLKKKAEAIAAAEKVDEKLNSVLDMPADKDNIEIFENALKVYDKSSALTKEFIKANIVKLRSLYQDSVRLHEEYEEKQQELRDRAEAQKVFEKMDKVYQNNPNGGYDEYDNLYEAYLLYEGLTHVQKQFFPNKNMLSRYEAHMTKAKKAKSNYDVAHKAEQDAQNSIKSIYGRADEDDRDKISRAFRYYKDLSEEQKAYFSSDLLSKMRRLKREADDDHDDQERRREERRRASYHHSHNSFNSGSSHHSGLGGRPSGGGVTRRF